MEPQVNRENAADALLSTGEGDAGFDAWTLDELAEDLGPYTRELGSLRSAFTGSDDAGG